MIPFRLGAKPPLGLNYLLKSLGFSFSKLPNPEDDPDSPSVAEKIRSLDGEFDLVLLSEYFPESLVLLSELLCWPLHRFASVPQKMRKQSDKVSYSKLPQRLNTAKHWK